jgi:hypothetical protein
MEKKITITLDKHTDISDAVSTALNPNRKIVKDFYKTVKCSKKNDEDNIKFGEMISENGTYKNLLG